MLPGRGRSSARARLPAVRPSGEPAPSAPPGRPSSTRSRATSPSTQERQAELRGEIDALDKDRATLNQALIETGKRVQELEAADRPDRAPARGAARPTRTTLRASLLERRDVLAEVLAALQRMGHRPPPAMLVRPEDALASVRSAILLGAVVPDLREAADQLAADLRQLCRSGPKGARARPAPGRRHRAAEERARIALLLEDKRRTSRAALGAALDDEQNAAPATSPPRRPASAT